MSIRLVARACYLRINLLKFTNKSLKIHYLNEIKISESLKNASESYRMNYQIIGPETSQHNIL